MSLESMATQVNLESLGILVILVNQENLGLQEDLVKMVLMEANITVPSVPKYMHMMEHLATQENQENLENKGLEDPLESLVMMQSVILESMVKTANLENPEIQEKMVCLENLVLMEALEIKLI